MQYFHRLSDSNGYQPLLDQSCQHLSFALLRLAPGQSYQGQTGELEVLLVALAGQAEVQVGEICFKVGGRPNVFAGNPHSIYLPRHQNYEVRALSTFEAALPAARSDLDIPPYEIRPEQVRTGQWGALNFSRQFREILVEPNGLPASRLIVGETITPSGNWSTYPPHKHEVEEGPEVFHEEMYYFRLSAPEGWGLVRHYSPERGYDQIHLVRDNTLLAIPHGYHTYVGAPGYTSYYLWFLAGKGRRQGVRLDPEVGWVQKAVALF